MISVVILSESLVSHSLVYTVAPILEKVFFVSLVLSFLSQNYQKYNVEEFVL